MLKSGGRPACLVLALLLGGCQSTVCEDQARAYADVATKSQPCLDNAPLPDFDAERCEDNLQACDPKDLEQLVAQQACYQRLDTCQPERRAAFLQGLTDCDNLAPSNRCEAAIF